MKERKKEREKERNLDYCELSKQGKIKTNVGNKFP